MAGDVELLDGVLRQVVVEEGGVGDRAGEVHAVVRRRSRRLAGPGAGEEPGAEVVDGRAGRVEQVDRARLRVHGRAVEVQRLGTGQDGVVPCAVVDGTGAHDRSDAAVVPEFAVQLAVGAHVQRRCVRGRQGSGDRAGVVAEQHTAAGGLEPQADALV